MGLWLGTWEGTILKETAIWLRFYDSSGNLVLLAQEERDVERERAEQERERADRAETTVEEERRKNQQLRDRVASRNENRVASRNENRLLQLGIDPDSQL
ncbi:hypothetical protein [Spirulina sp. CS-785/01]|uniref:hypothetical protein n=1 Tax=Spirulina sp. CS-785/01 TaxID=3021716 RepID=UPI00232C376C|nr:hypothetical protein [Spirulina sp. CS-785/01]